MRVATVLRSFLLAALGLALAAPLGAQVSGAVPRPQPSPTPRPAARRPAPRPPAVVPRFALEVEQDGAPVAITDGAAYLRRGPFTLLLESPQAEGVWLSASHDRAVHDAAQKGGSLDDAFRGEFSVAESSGNADQNLYLRPQALHALRVVDPRTLFFDSWSKAGPGFRARRTVSRLTLPDEQVAELATAPPRPLYLVLARGTSASPFEPIAVAETRTLVLFFDVVAPAVRERLEPHLRTLRARDQPLAARVAALQELARAGRDAVLVMDAGAQDEQSRAREAAVRARLQAVVAAERAYAAGNAGFFDLPACLLEPRKCNPRSKAVPTLQQPAEGEDDGYRRLFHPGAGVTAEEAKKRKVAPTSIRGFALTAVPTEPGPGKRGLCADDSGRVCAVEDPAGLDDLEEGRCPAACEDLP